MQHFESKQVILSIFFKVCVYTDTIVSLRNAHIFYLEVFLAYIFSLPSQISKANSRYMKNWLQA